jgi:hypothetical protein
MAVLRQVSSSAAFSHQVLQSWLVYVHALPHNSCMRGLARALCLLDNKGAVLVLHQQAADIIAP